MIATPTRCRIGRTAATARECAGRAAIGSGTVLRALDAPVTGQARARADAGDIGIVRMIVDVEEIEDAAAVRGRRHAHVVRGETAPPSASAGSAPAAAS
ncbi:MAG: hypothetical protein J0H86_07410 [Xanthomonadaceae bacterium]|nr:hypothetical protein [Xanthomonadaceae bacterium]